jgi:inner membrane protein
MAIGLAAAFYFMPHVNNKLLFLALVMISTLIPDIDSSRSSMGKKIVFRPLQMMSEHRGIMHSITMCVILSVAIVLIYPFAALPFFLGYSFHLIADSFTIQGIKPFWPQKSVSKGPVRTGGQVEKAVLVVFVIVDIALLVNLFI